MVCEDRLLAGRAFNGGGWAKVIRVSPQFIYEIGFDLSFEPDVALTVTMREEEILSLNPFGCVDSSFDCCQWVYHHLHVDAIFQVVNEDGYLVLFG